jgi:hypothetical protein
MTPGQVISGSMIHEDFLGGRMRTYLPRNLPDDTFQEHPSGTLVM